MMLGKIISNSLHFLVVAACVIAFLVYPEFWILIAFIGSIISISFKRHCYGFFYGDREKISVEIIEVGPSRSRI